MWAHYIKGFQAYLRLEKSSSANTVDAYTHDIELLAQYAIKREKVLEEIDLPFLQDFISSELPKEMAASSQARITSGIKTFFKYLVLEQVVPVDPAILLQAPKKPKYLPEVLSVEEVTALLDAVDLSSPEGHRNRAILETLYSSGLRVSELVNLRITNLYLDIGFIKVIGKGNKERLVPIGDEAGKQISIYRESERSKIIPRKGEEDIVFLNRRGARLSRVMIFYIIRNTAAEAGIRKDISPHTLRHTFATHLVEGGANLRAVQEMLGHESITTTEIYTHLDKQFLRATLEKYHPKF